MNEHAEYPLAGITLDQRLQPREALSQEVVEEYAARYADGEPMPAVRLVSDGQTAWLADGFHRFHAAKQAGREAINAQVEGGQFRDALLIAAGANAAHGLRRTNADKRRAVEMLLGDPECAAWSDNQIGKHCSVDHKTVSAVRESILGNSQDTGNLSHAGVSQDSPPPGAAPQLEAGPFNPCDGCGYAGRLRIVLANYPHPDQMPGDVDLICPECGRSMTCHPDRPQVEQWNEYNPLPPGAPAPAVAGATGSATRTVTRNGVTYQMNVGNIGKRSGPGPRGFETMRPWLAPNANGLLPCPFCGSADVALKRDDENSDCCGICRDRDCNAIGPRFRDPDKARDAWNRRA